MKGKNPYMEKTEEVVKNGGLLAQLFFDFHGTSKESVENTCIGFSSTLNKEEGVIFSISEIEKPIEQEGSIYSTYMKASILFVDFQSFCNFITKYTPISIEIIKPEEFKIKNIDLANSLLIFSNVLYDLKLKIYTSLLSENEKKIIEETVKKREELGKILKKGREDS
jgi:hypothetical protein